MSGQLRKPRIAIRVGIVGRRNLLSEGAVQDALEAVFCDVESAVSSSSARGFSDQEPLITLISPLAAGADRVAAKVATEGGRRWRIQAPIPGTREDYRTYVGEPEWSAFDDVVTLHNVEVWEIDVADVLDETDAPSVHRFVASAVCDNADVLVIVTNETEGGGGGGTADTVRRVDCQQRSYVRIHEGTGGRTSTTVVNASSVRDIVVSAVPTLDDDTELETFLERSTAGLKLFVPLALVWRTLRWAARAGYEQPSAQRSGVVAPPSAGLFQDYYEKADQLSSEFMDVYRGSYIASYMLGIGAIVCALLGHLVKPWDLTMTATKLGLLTAVALIVFVAGRGAWLERSREYRELAELLRHASPLVRFGLRPTDVDRPAQYDLSDEQSWTAWLRDALVRELGVPAIPDRNGRARFDSRQLLEDANAWVADQVRYHRRLEYTYKRLEVGSRNVIRAGFVGTIALVVAHLVPMIVDAAQAAGGGAGEKAGWVGDAMFFGVIFLPALVAAAKGLSEQGEFHRLGHRSEAMVRTLAAAETKLIGLQPDDLDDVRRAQEIVNQSASHMVAEVLEWRFVYLVHPVPIGI